jgi:transposase InsO family protein
MKMVTTVRATRQESLSEVCSFFDLKRDAYYKYLKRYKVRKSQEKDILKLVDVKRKVLPRVGVRKLMRHLEQDFVNANIKIGRDKLFTILREHDRLVKRRKTSCRTTNSYHHFHKYENQIKDFTPTGINQVWVTDITYLRTVKGFCYLALVTDLYSRKIVGYDICDSLELLGALRALKMALRKAKNLKRLIHHSDRGVQYCSNQYTGELLKRNIKISMTEENHCYENAVAERVNGILKDEFYLDLTFFSTELAQRASKNAIKLYNNERLHLSLDYKTPDTVYQNNEKTSIYLWSYLGTRYLSLT